ncbi:DUF1015 domain-containing protein [Psychroserpens sp.]|uniref:DUF1015 domain-containing protein n=1 Tax=Psychroserpens sp. TaxID=2020870 RepID=UPI001B1433BC|nr:DUF1015 domain-containing protein [Psychroserpens sp.]MBO6606783.1 DUF1015 domain-containing protein [Psychroserpens sp.]MBO6631183.1 DUF1015 domain-containing protein [Psychroserpens sp.]MBO6653486.1 DUF1015 domain-containing protein [Psychroserpens sp.]MBO6680486.1 DUF1015 domain-containing protein [Psychroserpens sp.]MBO6750555.1 DUF1015 domain-containing protein [Psychroserpens sp.]
MAKVIPFKAVRPTRAIVGLVAARPYQSYTVYERESRMDYNPYSFLHIVNPGYKYDKVITGEERYKLVRNRYLEFKEDGVFVQDDTPSYYVYKIVNRHGQEFNGIIAATSAEDYVNDVIKKHEDTIAKREQTFKTYLKTVGFNAEPVLLTYPDNDRIAEIIRETQKKYAEFEFTMTYRDTHYLWRLDNSEDLKTIEREFGEMKTIYIADGHHRSASSALLYVDERENNPDYSKTASYNYFMSYLIPESDLVIHEFNRLIKDLNGLTKEEFLIKLDEMYRIDNKGQFPYSPSKPHHFSMYLDGEFYSLYLRKANYTFNNALDRLDAQLLYETILKPVLGIDDLRNNNRIEYVNGRHEMITIKSSVDSGEFEVGFGMCPATVKQMKQIADEGLKMPPKSTYILPKLRSGITIYEF